MTLISTATDVPRNRVIADRGFFRYREDSLSVPLWVSSDKQPKPTDIPACACGAPREFEFQIMPQLLFFLKVDSKAKDALDWGTLVVYTCKESCGDGSKYAQEVVWVQPMGE